MISIDPMPAAAARGVNAVVFGLAVALLGQHNIYRLQPLCAAFCLADGLLLVVASRKQATWNPSARVQAGLSLGAAGVIWAQPLYAILTYSFLLQVHMIVWLMGMGLLTMAARRGQWDMLAGWGLITAALYLLIWEGAGMVENADVAGASIVVWGLGLLVSARGARMGA